MEASVGILRCLLYAVGYDLLNVNSIVIPVLANKGVYVP
jgi:hypothetical protein